MASPDSHGASVVVHGLVVGDPATALRDIGADTAEPSERHAVEHSVDAVIGGGGRVRKGGAVFDVVDGRIAAITLRDAALPEFGVASERDVPARFGAHEGVERALGATTIHYPARAFKLILEGSGRIVAIALGAYAWSPPCFDARSVLREFLEIADCLAAHDWKLPADANPARRVRWQRLSALLQAFAIADAKSLATGTFLRPGMAPIAFPRAELNTPGLNQSGVRWAYCDLLRYRRAAEHLLRHNSGYLECSVGVILEGIRMTSDVNAVLREQLTEVETVLCRLIDPDQRSFTSEQLAALGFPDVDVEQLELDDF